jgi:pimeloyl-ACP methyl ester carboxylesterase
LRRVVDAVSGLSITAGNPTAIANCGAGEVVWLHCTPQLSVTLLLIWGSRDPIMEPPVRDSLRKALPNAQVKVFDGLGHDPFWEDPAGVAGALNELLDAQP